ncbi:GNAT family N-acetyltransferase [Streptomyces sp. NPDC006733]|uniref:GNAT family N-acetyltransferase n=1 Tax=Streptomyces sp. NPDC006733 TaxID=3155460 RepID=UPI00340F8F12
MTTTRTPRIQHLGAADVLEHADALQRLYTAVFSAPPWNEDEQDAARFRARLAADALRPGFVAALAWDGSVLAGFATAWTTPPTLPSERSYPQVTAALGPERTTAWLGGARQVDELAVGPGHRGGGLGATLLAAIADGAPDGRCWLLTSLRATSAVRFYQRLGWTQPIRPAPGDTGITVFLSPHHPARTAADSLMDAATEGR